MELHIRSDLCKKHSGSTTMGQSVSVSEKSLALTSTPKDKLRAAKGGAGVEARTSPMEE
jgi:hypothetical protein